MKENHEGLIRTSAYMPKEEPGADNNNLCRPYKIEIHADICSMLTETYGIKNNDYGDSFGKGFKEYGMTMPCIRLEDKLNRLKSLTVQGKDQQVKDESITDTLADLANYAIMTLIELEINK